jgi:hypothetical protein
MGRLDMAHSGLRKLSTREVARELPPWLESIYRCDDCDALMLHSDSLRLQTGHWQII